MSIRAALFWFSFTVFALPSQAQVWEEDQPIQNDETQPDAKDAGASDTAGGVPNDEQNISPVGDPFIIKSDKAFKRVRRLDLAGMYGYNPTTGRFQNDVLGFSFWATLPSLEKGFLADLNDSFNLEAGLFSEWKWSPMGASHDLIFMPAMGGRWNFHLTHKWTLYSAARVGLEFTKIGLRPHGAGALGALWQLKPHMSLKAELNTRHFLNVGVSFPY